MAATQLSVSAATALFVLALLQWALKRRRPDGRAALAGAGGSGQAQGHNLQRKAALANGGPVDHAGSVVVVPNDLFDVTKTIYKSATGLFAYLVRAKISNRHFWSDLAVQEWQASYARLPAVPSMDKAVMDFVAEECDFSMEHADGSFWDHLRFCRDYSALHYSQHSPRVLFLHSILGVGTNLFPMSKEKIPQLRHLLSDFEFRHVEAFPTVLRLISSYSMVDELTANLGRLEELKSVEFFRVIDNAPINMSAGDLWIQLNFHAIHFMDFLPVANWAATASDTHLQAFGSLVTFLQKSGKLEARLDFQCPTGQVDLEGQPLTLAACIARFMPRGYARRQFIRAWKQRSAKIGHTLEYKLIWAD